MYLNGYQSIMINISVSTLAGRRGYPYDFIFRGFKHHPNHSPI